MTGASAAREGMLGGAATLAAYLLWGGLPIYFVALEPSGPWEIVAWRVLLSLAFCVIALTVVRGGWRRLLPIVRSPRLMSWTVLGGALIFVNWTVYLIATLTGHVIEAALGYFINPVVTVLLGVIVLRERLRPAQWAAIGLAMASVVVIVVGYGHAPWIALMLAFSFGLYGLVKKRVGPSVDALSGLTLETAWLVPVAVGILVWVGVAGGGITIGTHGVGHGILLGLAGVVTAVPLLLFAAGARRVPLSVVGLLQFVTPIMQFIIGAAVLHEQMTTERWIGFVLVWVALVVLTVDSLRGVRRVRDASDVADVV